MTSASTVQAGPQRSAWVHVPKYCHARRFAADSVRSCRQSVRQIAGHIIQGYGSLRLSCSSSVHFAAKSVINPRCKASSAWLAVAGGMLLRRSCTAIRAVRAG